jgi:HK97 gp10 family phage protein
MSRTTIDRRHLNSIKIDSIAVTVMDSYADELKNDITSNWSSTSPSNAGSPPAIRTGKLNRDVRRSRIANGFLTIDSDYAHHLEYGTRKMRPRPFVLPALKRVAKSQVPVELFKDELK